MAETMVELDGVGKRYRLGEHLGQATDLREAIMERVTRGRRKPSVDELWALRDISLQVNDGEVLGIIGRNGAGKSTLLKIVGGVTTPTVGVSRTRGRIGSLLEVGTGFNDDLTGRENTYLSGAILGMRRAEVDRQLEEIVDFAGLDDFMDTPVKRYSSGMYLRLAFAVAAHLQADILLVDEVLAVGDAEFRRKCLAKMSDVGSSGRTVLFASHNLDALTQLCTNAVWFDEGRIAASGPVGATVRQYLSAANSGQRTTELTTTADAPAALRTVTVLDRHGSGQSAILGGEPVIVELEIDVDEAPPEVDVSVIVARVDGPLLLDENLAEQHEALSRPGRYRLRLELPPILTPAEYSITVWMGTSYDDVATHDHVLTFSVEGDDPDKADRLIDLRAPWTTELITPAS